MGESLIDLAKYPLGFPAIAAGGVLTIFSIVLVAAMVLFARSTREINPTEHYVRPFLTIIVVMAFVMVAVMALTRNLPDNEQIGLLMGALISGFSVTVAYWFNRSGE